jgi:hypothetical protein
LERKLAATGEPFLETLSARVISQAD